MSEPWDQSLRVSMSSSADSPVRTSALLERAQDWPALDLVSGMSFSDSFAHFDPVGSLWRTSQLCFSGELTPFSETWPDSGSMQSGRVSARAAWVRHMCDDECSLWPTPTASMDGRGFGIPLHARSGRYKRSTVLRVQELVTVNGWRIHPHFTETLMGFPLGWTEIEGSAMPSRQPPQNGSPAESSKPSTRKDVD